MRPILQVWRYFMRYPLSPKFRCLKQQQILSTQELYGKCEISKSRGSRIIKSFAHRHIQHSHITALYLPSRSAHPDNNHWLYGCHQYSHIMYTHNWPIGPQWMSLMCTHKAIGSNICWQLTLPANIISNFNAVWIRRLNICILYMLQGQVYVDMLILIWERSWICGTVRSGFYFSCFQIPHFPLPGFELYSFAGLPGRWAERSPGPWHRRFLQPVSINM